MKSFVESEGAFIIAGLFAFSAVVVSGVNIVFHLMNYVKPNLQKSIVRILLIIPIYSICSWASLVMKDEELYFDVIRDIYEAYIIYLFLVLILEYDGGPSACVSKLSDQTMEHPVPCCLLPRINLGQRFLRYCKQGTLQFVIVKPIMAMFSLLMLGIDEYFSEEYQWLLSCIYNISYSISLVALLYFYLAIKSHVGRHGIMSKFLAVKTVVFMTYYQNLIVLTLNVDTASATRWNDFILCLEMLGFAYLHWKAFPADEFARINRNRHGREPVLKAGSVTEALAEVLSVKDVIDDTKKNFGDEMPIEQLRGVALLETQKYLTDNDDDDDYNISNNRHLDPNAHYHNIQRSAHAHAYSHAYTDTDTDRGRGTGRGMDEHTYSHTGEGIFLHSDSVSKPILTNIEFSDQPSSFRSNTHAQTHTHRDSDGLGPITSSLPSYSHVQQHTPHAHAHMHASPCVTADQENHFNAENNSRDHNHNHNHNHNDNHSHSHNHNHNHNHANGNDEYEHHTSPTKPSLGNQANAPILDRSAVDRKSYDAF